jgi:DNA-binding transcriptional regulator YhcF (GntR family)
MTYKEQLDTLNTAYDLISQANALLMKNGMGTFSYDEHDGHKRTFSYLITEVRQRVVEAMNSINQTGSAITEYINQKDREDGRAPN